MSSRRARWPATLTVAAALLATSCTHHDDKPYPESHGLPAAKPGEVVSLIGDGTARGAETSPSARENSVAHPVAVLDGSDGALIVGQGGNSVILSVAHDGSVRQLVPATSGMVVGALVSVARLGSGTLATLEVTEDPSGSLLRLGRVAGDGRVTEWAKLRVSGAFPGTPALTVAPWGDLLVIWNGRVWVARTGSLAPYPVPVPGVVRAVADGNRLLVATNDRLYRLQGGKVWRPLPVRSTGGPGSGGRITAVTPDGAGGAYVAMTAPAAITHVTADASIVPVASADGAANCAGHVSGAAVGATPLKDPQSLLVKSGQLIVADEGCNRVYSVGIR
jgi:hypothetical protein